MYRIYDYNGRYYCRDSQTEEDSQDMSIPDVTPASALDLHQLSQDGETFILLIFLFLFLLTYIFILLNQHGIEIHHKLFRIFILYMYILVACDRPRET